MRLLMGALLASGCAKLIEGGCASDADCDPGVGCNLETNRCAPPPCFGANLGDDDDACGIIDCDGLDDACVDYEDVIAGRCLGDGVCKPANDPMTCGSPVDLCSPYTCDDDGPEPACRASCDGDAECATGVTCIAGRCCETGWELHTIDSDGDVGKWARVVVDAEGDPHGVWLDLTDEVVRVGESTATALDSWTVASIGDSFAAPDDSNALALGVGSGGAPHVVYRSAPSGAIVHAYHDGSDWVSLGEVLPGEAALAVNTVGMAHVISSAATLEIDYDYAVVDSASGGCGPGWIGLRLAATTDASGRIHATWWDLFSLYYAIQDPTCDPTAPTDLDCCLFEQTVAAPTPGGTLDPMARHDIAFDDDAAVAHITYVAPDTSDLWHASCSEGDCSSEPIDEGSNVGRFSSVAVGGGGVHVVYYDASAGNLRYATHARGSWESYAVDEEGDVGAFASLAYGPDGRLHALYYDADAKDARYATLSSVCVPGE